MAEEATLLIPRIKILSGNSQKIFRTVVLSRNIPWEAPCTFTLYVGLVSNLLFGGAQWIEHQSRHWSRDDIPKTLKTNMLFTCMLWGVTEIKFNHILICNVKPLWGRLFARCPFPFLSPPSFPLLFPHFRTPSLIPFLLLSFPLSLSLPILEKLRDETGEPILYFIWILNGCNTSRFVRGYIVTISIQRTKSKFHTLAFKSSYTWFFIILLALSVLTPVPRATWSPHCCLE